MMDAQARVVENNPANKVLWGAACLSPARLPPFQLWRGWWPETGKPLALEEWAIMRALTSGETITNQEVAFETSSGQPKMILASAIPIRDEQGAIRGAVGIHQDITQRKRLEDALRRAEQEAAAHAQELEAIFEALTDSLLVYDAEGRILRCNTAARQLFGFEAQPEFAALPWKERAVRYVLRDAEGHPPLTGRSFGSVPGQRLPWPVLMLPVYQAKVLGESVQEARPVPVPTLP